MPNAAFDESPGSIGIDNARTPGTVVGNGGVAATGVGPATAVVASGIERSTHAANDNTTLAAIQDLRMWAPSYPIRASLCC